MIELRWMKLKDARPDAAPVLQVRHFIGLGGWTDWREIPLVFVNFPDDETGSDHSNHYGD